MSRKIISIAAAAVVGLALAGLGAYGPVRAMDEATITNQDVAPPPPACASGQIFDSKKGVCVAAASVVACDKGFTYDVDKKTCVKTTAMNDDQLYYQGRMLALAGHYDSAIDALGAVANKTSNVLTMIGYSTRKMGNLDQGIAIYHQALAIDPKNLSTHEYLGEGYLAAGRVDLAENELDTLQTLCGNVCVQFQALSNAIYNGTWTN
jgi:tetratricopeptide (TPR) repeat protein